MHRRDDASWNLNGLKAASDRLNYHYLGMEHEAEPTLGSPPRTEHGGLLAPGRAHGRQIPIDPDRSGPVMALLPAKTAGSERLLYGLPR